jgi:ketosteroid isomerase-like protein
VLLAASLAIATSCGVATQEDVAASVIALERGALDRWGKGDPQGYLEIYAPELTYFDPVQDTRIDGLDAMKAMIAPFTGKIRVDRFDMIGPKVQQHGDVAVLTFNLLSHRTQPDGKDAVIARWNSTSVYRRMNGTWKVIHSHWSYIKPELKTPVSESTS